MHTHLLALSFLILSATACTTEIVTERTNGGERPRGDRTTAPPPGDPNEPSPNPPTRSPEQTAKCDALSLALQAAVEKARTTPSAALAIDNPTCGTKTFTSGALKDVPAGTSRLWRIASVTKTYTAATALLLVEEQRLSLDDLVTRWLPNFQPGRQATIRQLLSHTSGIADYEPTILEHASNDPNHIFTPEELATVAANLPTRFEPGQRHEYSNSNFVVLGLVVEAVTRQSFGTRLRSSLLGPQKLDATFFDGEEAVPTPLVPGFDPEGRDITRALPPSITWAAGAIVATPGDVARWMTRLSSGNVLRPETLQAMRTDITHAGYGLGLAIVPAEQTLGNGPAYGHSGALNGYRSAAYWFPEKKTAVVGLLNQSGADTNALLLEALEALATFTP